ncbi:MAG: hypothetical protein DRI90_23720 [Deltaproteobacteria bacterium]|nr:MAG: hypothetical protein DRI90_23720 [Deltaproteobacteria bacterium]
MGVHRSDRTKPFRGPGARLGLLGLMALAQVGCGGANLASGMATAPEYRPRGQTKCSVKVSQTRPLIVEWPAADRGALEAQQKRGTVVVRYTGCEMEVLRQCSAPGAYRYVPVTLKEDHVRIRNADELYAAIPMFAAKFEGKLEAAGELRVDMSIIGTFEAERPQIKVAELEGACSRATHVVAAITAGAFEFSASASATVGAGVEAFGTEAGAESSAEREMLNRDGDRARCQLAASTDEAPPDGCGALLRVEVVPLGRATGTWAGSDPDAPPPGWEPSPYVGEGAKDVPPGSTGDRQRRLGTVSLVIGSVLLVTGIGAGAGAIALDADLDEACGDDPCHPEHAGVVRGYDWLAALSTVGFIGGGTLGAAGGILLMTAPSASGDDEGEAAATIAPLLGPGRIGVTGRF